MEKYAYLIPLVVAIGGWVWAWRDSKRRDTVDPMSAASAATKVAAETVTELLEPMRKELQRLRVEVMVLREVLAANGLPLPDPSFIDALVRDLE